MTQHKKILQLLSNNEWVCSSAFYASYIADPRTRICELKKKGFELVDRWCENPLHRHEGMMKEWKLVSAPAQKVITSDEILKISLGAK